MEKTREIKVHPGTGGASRICGKSSADRAIFGTLSAVFKVFCIVGGIGRTDGQPPTDSWRVAHVYVLRAPGFSAKLKLGHRKPISQIPVNRKGIIRLKGPKRCHFDAVVFIERESLISGIDHIGCVSGNCCKRPVFAQGPVEANLIVQAGGQIEKLGSLKRLEKWNPAKQAECRAGRPTVCVAERPGQVVI